MLTGLREAWLPESETNHAYWDLLRNCRALARLSVVALQDLFAVAQQHSFERGEALVSQGDPAEGLLILLEGTAHALLRSREGDHRLGHFTSGDVVGEMALVTGEARSADVIADSPVLALLVPTAAFNQLATRHLELGMVLTELVADRLGQGVHDGFGDKRVGGFHILQCIGRGGMSVVYRARDESTGELVALKMMSYRLIYDSAALARFHQEANLLQDLEHENIASLKRLFPAYRTYFLVMELCAGVDLDRLVRERGRLPESQVRPILGQLARALWYIHTRGLVHRDLKPANVMIDAEGRVKLTDFGLAMPVILPDDQQTRAVDHAIIGTPAFMAPEQLSGGLVDRRTDVYALGCLAFELLTGQRLFSSTNLFELIQEKVTKRLPPSAEIGEGVSPELYGFLEAALHVNANDRPSSTTHLVKWADTRDPPLQGLVTGAP